MRLTAHFHLSEFTTSQYAERHGIENIPGPEAVDNLRRLCSYVLEPVRSKFGAVIVSSGFRCLALNRGLGSKDNSAHVEGRAADFTCPRADLADVFDWISGSGLQYDQVIFEFSRWIHIGVDKHPRGQNLIAERIDGRTQYRVA